MPTPGTGQVQGCCSAGRRGRVPIRCEASSKGVPVNAPFSRLPRLSSPPATTQFAPTLPMEAMDHLAAVDASDWHDTQPQPGTAADLAALALLHATPPADSGHDSAFHEPLGGLQMRELESPELFEHLFGPSAGG